MGVTGADSTKTGEGVSKSAQARGPLWGGRQFCQRLTRPAGGGKVAGMKKLTSEKVGEKLRELSGNMAAVARSFGVSRQSVFAFIKARPSLQAIVVECRETLLDNCESILHRAILSGAPWAVRLFLLTIGKNRGYVQRTEVSGREGGPVKHVVETVVRSRAEAKELLAALREGNDRFTRNGEP